MHYGVEPGQVVFMGGVRPFAFDMASGEEPRKHNAGAIFCGMKAFARQLHYSFVPLWGIQTKNRKPYWTSYPRYEDSGCTRLCPVACKSLFCWLRWVGRPETGGS